MTLPYIQRSHHAETVIDRLVRLRRWGVTGLAAAAELELHAWCRETKCPSTAALLHAKLGMHRGEFAVALEDLTAYESKHQSNDAEILQTLVSLSWLLDQHQQAELWLGQLRTQVGYLPAIQEWIQAMDEMQQANPFSSIDAQTEQLAVELMDHISVMPSLVVAMKLQSDDKTIAALRSALNHAYRDIHTSHDQIVACEALAELALLAEDSRDARRWAHRGRRLDPYHARFALVLAEIDDDAAVGPPAAVALGEALRINPNYPDVRAALIRREFADGQTTAARRRLRVWLNDQPEHPMALKLKQELAA